VVSSVQISGSLCVVLEHTYVLGVQTLSGSLSSNKWFAVCYFGTHTCVSGVECQKQLHFLFHCHTGQHMPRWSVKRK